jgi:hypothetical protein
MFIQVVEGMVADERRFRAQLQRWVTDLAPGAYGYLGSTGGVTEDGRGIFVLRFATEDDARRNSDRYDQGAWWAETRACFDGPVLVHETTDVHLMRHGDADAAGFVQVLTGQVLDREAARRFDEVADDVLAVLRPDLLGTITAYHADGGFTELAYFRSEREAREAEAAAAAGVSPEVADTLARFEETMRTERYLDLRQPWLTSPTTDAQRTCSSSGSR